MPESGHISAFPSLPGLDLATDGLPALQFERLRWTLQHAYDNNSHYRSAFDKAGVQPSDLKSLADLSRFPFTAKADLRANYPFGFYSVPMDQIARIHASSGTTGKPTVVGYTRADLDTWAMLIGRSLQNRRRQARYEGAYRLRLRPLHRRLGRAFRG